MTVQEWRKKMHDKEQETAARAERLRKAGFRVAVTADGRLLVIR